MMQEPVIFTLPNGIRIAHKEVTNTRVAHCGIALDIGSRDESEISQGIAHFWEHMAFKGTKKRKAYHIINRLDSVGGELNAFTTKEKIHFYASIMDNHLENAIELLKDITFDSIFPPNQIEKEKKVILEEMAMYQDSPEDSLHDDFDEVVFKNHPLGFNILGTQKSVNSFHQEDFHNFLKTHLNTHKIVFSCVGNISFKKVKKLAEKYFSSIPETTTPYQRKPFNSFAPRGVEINKPISQAHCAMGSTAFSYNHEKRTTLFMLNNLLGGPAMNSRLNLELRERKGFVYSIESSFQSYEDTGLMGIFFATEKTNLNKAINSIWRELNALKNKKMGINQLKSSKDQLMGQIAISEERNLNFMLMMGKSLLDYNKIETLNETFDKIQKIDASEIMEVANEIFQQDTFSYLKYLPQN